MYSIGKSVTNKRTVPFYFNRYFFLGDQRKPAAMLLFFAWVPGVERSNWQLAYMEDKILQRFLFFWSLKFWHFWFKTSLLFLGLGTSTSKEAKEYFSDMVRHKIKFKYDGTGDDDSIDWT